MMLPTCVSTVRVEIARRVAMSVLRRLSSSSCGSSRRIATSRSVIGDDASETAVAWPSRSLTCAPINRLIHQTRPENIGVNRLLDRFIPIAETSFVAMPDGLALPGIFNLRHVMRDDLPRIMAMASEGGGSAHA